MFIPSPADISLKTSAEIVPSEAIETAFPAVSALTTLSVSVTSACASIASNLFFN